MQHSDPKQTAQFLWVGSDLSPLENVCLKSFVAVGYETHLYTYGNVGNIPAGVIVKNAAEIIPESEVFVGAGSRGGSYAPFADRFRYHLLFAKGGWWFDTDHIALKLLPEPTDLLIATQWEGEHGEYPTVSAIWCEPGDQRVQWLRDRADEILSSGVPDDYTRLGPKLMNEMVDHFGLKDNLAPWWEFNSYPYYYVRFLAYKGTKAWLKDVTRYIVHRVRELRKPNYRAAYIRPGSRALHLSNEIWRAEGLDKNVLYHPGCTYGRLQRKHGFDPAEPAVKQARELRKSTS